ncbi:MAG: hypothetical protein WCK89_12365, partial [bacterium]
KNVQPPKWDPKKNLAFLMNYLTTIAPPPTPLVIVQHFDGASIDKDKRKELYEVIRKANVLAILYGHTHITNHEFFPNDVDYKEFGAGGPRFDCFASGGFKHGPPINCADPQSDCYVFRITTNRFVAVAHYLGGKKGWKDACGVVPLTVVKDIAPPLR